MSKNLSDMMGAGLLLVGLYILLSILIQQNILTNILGVIGATIIIFSQAVFLWQKFM